MAAREVTRATREHSAAERKAWFRWRRRWHELERESPGERRLVVCATCARYRDGRGRWMPMPSGLNDVLASGRGLCVSHGLCSTCSTRALQSLKLLPPSEPDTAGSTRG
jgi:hypothetical protein